MSYAFYWVTKVYYLYFYTVISFLNNALTLTWENGCANKENLVQSFHTVFLWFPSTYIHFVFVQLFIVWNVFGFNAGSETYNSEQKQKKYLYSWSQTFRPHMSVFDTMLDLLKCYINISILKLTCQCLKPCQIYSFIYLRVGTQRFRPHLKFALCIKSCGLTLIIRTC